MLQAYVTKARVMLQEHYNSRGALEMCIRDSRKEGAAEGGSDNWGEVVTR